MLHVAPWSRWPLRVHFFSESHLHLVTCCRELPPHMKQTVGEMEVLHQAVLAAARRGRFLDAEEIDVLNDDNEASSSASPTCFLCKDRPEGLNVFVKCPASNCGAQFHVVCLAPWCLQGSPESQLIPESGTCPCCGAHFSWIEVTASASRSTTRPLEEERACRTPACNGEAQEPGGMYLREDEGTATGDSRESGFGGSPIFDASYVDQHMDDGWMMDDECYGALGGDEDEGIATGDSRESGLGGSPIFDASYVDQHMDDGCMMDDECYGALGSNSDSDHECAVHENEPDQQAQQPEIVVLLSSSDDEEGKDCVIINDITLDDLPDPSTELPLRERLRLREAQQCAS